MKPLTHRDPGDETLFDVQTTIPPTCTSCGTSRRSLCRWDADREHGGLAGKQPRTCLLRHDPSTAAIPF